MSKRDDELDTIELALESTKVYFERTIEAEEKIGARWAVNSPILGLVTEALASLKEIRETQ